MNTKPVRPETYDDAWIASAWGQQRNEHLLKPGAIEPRPRVARAIKLADIHPGQRVLDIACGRGEVPAIAREMGAYAVGIDFSSTVLAIASQVKAARAHKCSPSGEMELICADACLLPFRSDSFDRVTLLDIVEHLVPEQLDKMLQEVRRILKPDGFAVIHTLPNRWVYDITYPLLRKLSPKLPPDPRGDIEKQVHVNEQDLPSLHHTLTKNRLLHRLWLEQFMPAQARWNAANDQYGDNRDQVYPALCGPMGRALDYLSLTPLKLLLCNDIFGLLWKKKKPQGAKPRFSLVGRIACLLPPRNKPDNSRHPR